MNSLKNASLELSLDVLLHVDFSLFNFFLGRTLSLHSFLLSWISPLIFYFEIMRIGLFRPRDVLVVRDEELVIPKELVWKKINKRNGTDSTGGSAFGAAAAPAPPSPVDDPLPPPAPAASTSEAAASSTPSPSPSPQVSTTSAPATNLPSAAVTPPTSSSVTGERAPSPKPASISPSPTDTPATTQLVPHSPSSTDTSQTIPPQPTATMTATPSTSIKTFVTSFSAAADSLPSFTSAGALPSSETNGAHGGGSIDANPSTASGIVQGSAGNTTTTTSKAMVAVSVVGLSPSCLQSNR